MPRTRRYPFSMERLPLRSSQRRCGKKRFNGGLHLRQSGRLKSRFGQETRPLLLFRRIRGKFLRQHERGSCRERGFSAFECVADRIGERFTIEFELPRQCPQVVEILHATILHAETHGCFELFGDDSFARVCAQVWRRESEQSRIIELDRSRRDRVGKAYVRLQVDMRGVELGEQPEANARVRMGFAYLLATYAAG